MFNRKRSLILGLGLLGMSLIVSGCHKKAVRAPAPPAPPAPAPAPAEPTVNLTVEPATIEKGQSATLSWTATNATDVDVEPGVGKVQPTGTTTVSPTDSTTYIATATGPGGRATQSARLTVTVPPPPAPPAPSEVVEEAVFDREVRDAYFDFDKADIRPDAQQALTTDASFFKAHASVIFTIEGHCDERGSEEYNLGLGERRAEAAKNYLVNLGVSADRIFTISYGKERPQCMEHNEDCWQRNRRAHFHMGRVSK